MRAAKLSAGHHNIFRSSPATAASGCTPNAARLSSRFIRVSAARIWRAGSRAGITPARVAAGWQLQRALGALWQPAAPTTPTARPPLEDA